MQLAACQAHLQALEELAQHAPTYQNWCIYLTGILANEYHHDWAEGERLFKSLLETELEPTLHGRTLIALGRTYDYQGRWVEALAAYEQCLTVFNQPDQAIDRATIWRNMAITLEKGFTQGEFDHKTLQKAVTYCQLALETLQTLENSNQIALALPTITWNMATTWNTLGLIYRNLGDWPQASRCYKRCIDLAHALDDRHDIGIANHNLGEVLQRQGAAKWSEALQAYLTALEIYRDPEFDDKYNEIDVMADLASLYHDMSDLTTAFDYYGQAIELIETLRAGVTSSAAQAGFFATVVDTYANTVLLCLEMNNQEQAFNYVEQARARSFLDMLAARSSDLSQAIESKPMTLAEVQAALPPEALLLEYFTTGLSEARLDRKVKASGVQRHRFPPAKTLLFAITRDTLDVYDLGISPNDLRPRQFGSVIERHFLKPKIQRMLYGRLIAPVEKLIQDKGLIYFIPHGPLHYVPFQALRTPDGETLLRETGPQLHYAPSATLLFHQRPTPADPASRPCLALGYNDQGATRLRFAEGEAHSIARLTGGRALTGDSPKKARLYDQAARYRLLHFSCHGQFNPESPLASALRIGPDETLTGLDVLDHLDLHSDLVTLSACESGLSRVRRGDELVGFVRAFMYAGASALVCTLWRVDERSTWLLMEKFYQEIEAGLGFAEALKRAQLYLRNLTRQEILDQLVRFSLDETGTAGEPVIDAPTSATIPTTTWSQARAYLKDSIPAQEQDRNPLLEAADDDKVFADPFYWAPFILVGIQRPEDSSGG